MKIKLRKISFYTAWPLRFYYEYDMSSTRTAYISSLVCPNIDDYLSLVANRGFWQRDLQMTRQGCTWSLVILFAKYSVWSTRTCSVWFSYSNCLVEVKVQARFKLYFGGSMHLSNFCEKKAASTSLDYSWNFTDPIITGLSFGQTDGVTCLAHFFFFSFFN